MFFKLIKQLQKNYVFKTLASAKTAVVLLLLLASVVAVGTFYESHYNAEYAQILIYSTSWFSFLIGLIGLLIFNAMISRLPWKRRHLGFLLTHIGMITILIGAYFTKVNGIDGHLRVAEQDRSNKVVLNENVLEFSSDSVFKKILVPKSTSSLSGRVIKQLNKQLSPYFEVTSHRPFVEEPDQALQQGLGEGFFLKFKLVSPFFSKEIWLHSVKKKETQMGPATFRLLSSDEVEPIAEKKVNAPKIKKRETLAKKAKEPELLAYKFGSDKILKRWTITQLLKHGAELDGVKIKIKKVYKMAIVDKNIMIEGTERINPALELDISKSGQTEREVLYGKFSGFSLHDQGLFGLRFKYEIATPTKTTTAPIVNPKAITTRSLVDFITLPNGSIKLRLVKNSKVILEQIVHLNQEITTPWMGMKITITVTSTDTNMPEESAITAIQPPPKSPFLPPSALRIQPKNNPSQSFWLTLGYGRDIQIENKTFHVYYGKNIITLPFEIYLDTFSKKNYPGSDKAFSFESEIRIDNETTLHKVSMNEPIKREGYTLYQSSYEQQPGQVTASIFSINRDPGRWIKYLGSFVLCAGIIIFTISRRKRGFTINKSDK